jgi:hypothetical protein
VKESPHIQRAGMDIGEVLQRDLFTLDTDDGKVQGVSTTYTLLFPLPSETTALQNFGNILVRPTSLIFSQLLRDYT